MLNFSEGVHHQSNLLLEEVSLTSAIALIGAANGTDTAFIIDTNTVQITNESGDTLATILARHAVAIDVNGHITGFEVMK